VLRLPEPVNIPSPSSDTLRSTVAQPGLLTPGATTQYGHPYQKLRISKQSQLLNKFHCTWPNNLTFAEHKKKNNFLI
jgi:hypothetical protein